MSTNNSKSKIVEETLEKPDIHRRWVSDYYTAESDKFYEKAFDYITSILNAPENSTFLDAGCGNCAHSIRLAKRGYFVMAVDFSEYVLKTAEANVLANGLQGKIKLQRENILSLTFEDKAFDYILCWGVLMHIPDVENAISELARVLKPGGMLVISEANMHSLQSIVLRNLRRLLGKEKANITPAGVEHWITTPTGGLLARTANISWLIEKFKNRGFSVKKRVAGQFTELHTRFSGLPKDLICRFNELWFNCVKIPHLAFGNIVIFQKEVMV